MAYDLIFRRQTTTNLARDAGAAPKIAGGIGLLASIAMILIPRLRRRSEIQQYRREYARDYHGNKLNKTQEMPAIPMERLVRQPID
jgi:hypothetical protein